MCKQPLPQATSTENLVKFGRVVSRIWSHTYKHTDRLLAVLLPCNNLGEAVHTHVPLSSSSITWYRSHGSDVLGREGNHMSGVPLAMHHKLQNFIHLRVRGLGKADEHSPHWVWYTFYRKLMNSIFFSVLLTAEM